ncbi:hypothetical protein GCM10011584_08680 [Nocardioides phosphati]|uniref:GerMN domain-containing protein n=1 Tax=Nocardioides phosphati TaxID=1867775 RepID=A0ABQ2N6M2_9ACTN|nr:Gmad2 immunoglobulin-like domain-containing protein [Nocardioides phosphati]GGO86420.1 hypothetical protein GCM10011584_08680 [Nocardioides phosphati]
MNDRFHEDDLAQLIREAADQVQPHPALDAIRARTVTSPKESPMSVARTWLLGGLGGAVATAAVIGGVWFATTNGDDSPTPGPAESPTGTITGSQSPTPTQSASPSPSNSSAPTSPLKAHVAYFAGDAPGGLALYREFFAGNADDLLVDAVGFAATGDPKDRDYRTLWPAGTEVRAAYLSDEPGDGLITIDLSGNLHDRPAQMTEREASLAIEQLIYTAQGSLGMGRLPVQLLLDGKHTDTILGVPTSEPLANAPVLKTLSHVNISTPAEGDVITGDTIDVTGVANSFEANVVLRLQRYEGTYIAFQGPVTADGWMGDKLFPFSTKIDISKVEPGTYTLMAVTDDPSGGAEGNGAFTDSKVITIK